MPYNNCHGHSHGSHDHTGQQKTSDLITKMGAVIGGVTSFFGMFFFVAQIVDTFGEFEKKFAEVSYEGMSAGFVFALLTTVGATWCHIALSINNQNAKHSERCAGRNGADMDQSAVSLATITPKQESDASVSSPPTASTHLLVGSPQSHLTKFHWMLLIGDFVSHASGIASPILFLLLYAFDMEKYQKGIAYASCLALGCIGSIADFRICRNALLEREAADKKALTQDDTIHTALIAVQP